METSPNILAVILAVLVPPGEDPERGDVPGWVLITLMTAALVVAIWAVAGTRLVDILNQALDRISVI